MEVKKYLDIDRYRISDEQYYGIFGRTIFPEFFDKNENLLFVDNGICIRGN